MTGTSMNSSKLRLCVWLVCIQAMSALMGVITRSQIPEWYQTIHRSPLTPPGYVFGLVWPLLYIMIAIAGWQIWQHRDPSLIKRCYLLQLLLNWAWTPVFFHYHWLGAGALIIAAIISLLILLITKLTRLSTRLLLVPYLVWSCFALYLNGFIYFNN